MPPTHSSLPLPKVLPVPLPLPPPLPPPLLSDSMLYCPSNNIDVNALVSRSNSSAVRPSSVHEPLHFEVLRVKSIILNAIHSAPSPTTFEPPERSYPLSSSMISSSPLSPQTFLRWLLITSLTARSRSIYSTRKSVLSKRSNS